MIESGIFKKVHNWFQNINVFIPGIALVVFAVVNSKYATIAVAVALFFCYYIRSKAFKNAVVLKKTTVVALWIAALISMVLEIKILQNNILLINSNTYIRSRALLLIATISLIIVELVMIITGIIILVNDSRKRSEKKTFNKKIMMIMAALSALQVFSARNNKLIDVIFSVLFIVAFWIYVYKIYMMLIQIWKENKHYCPSCLHTNSSEKKFCTKCGYKL